MNGWAVSSLVGATGRTYIYFWGKSLQTRLLKIFRYCCMVPDGQVGSLLYLTDTQLLHGKNEQTAKNLCFTSKKASSSALFVTRYRDKPLHYTPNSFVISSLSKEGKLFSFPSLQIFNPKDFPLTSPILRHSMPAS